MKEQAPDGGATPPAPRAHLLEQILAATPDLIFMIDGSGRCLYANRAAASALGLAVGDIVGRRAREVGGPGSLLALTDEERSNVLKTGRPINGWIRARTAYGIRRVAYTLSPVATSDGPADAVVLTARLGSDRSAKSTAQALLQSVGAESLACLLGAIDRLARLQRVTAALSAGTTGSTLTHLIVTEGAEALGAQAGIAAVLTASGTELEVVDSTGIRPETARRWRRIPISAPLVLAEAARTGEPIWVRALGEWLARHPTFATWAELADYEAFAGIPVRVGDRVIGALGFAFKEIKEFDSSEKAFIETLAHQCALALERARLLVREEALATLGQALARQREVPRVAATALEQSVGVLRADAAALWVVDPNRGVLKRLASENLPVPLAKALKTVPFDLPIPASRAACTRQIHIVEDVKASLEDRAELRIFEECGLRSILAIPLVSRGHLVGVISHYSRQPRCFSSDEREFIRTVGDLFAVSIENAQLYDQVREALRLREEFMATAAHELRTPVTVIKGRAQLLLMRTTLPQQARQNLETVVRHADRISQLVDDMLAVVRVRPGVVALQRALFDLGDETRRRVASIARSTEIHTFHTSIQPNLMVDADRPLIDEVISRLIENALRYEPRGGLVEVRVARAADNAVVSVTDHGLGFSPERIAHAFEPFFELIPPGAEGYTGIISLGLYLSRQIVEAHGGRIWVQSAPGRGSTFSFSLPLATPFPP